MSLFTAVREVLGGFKSLVTGMRITLQEAAKPPITVQYPRETLKMPARFRGHIKLLLDPETGAARCTACTLCARACPSGCIVVDGVRNESTKKKVVSKYELDFTTCSLCGSCVEICPSDAIDFSKDYNVVSLSRDTFAHMDLFKKVQLEAAHWTSAHPQPTPASEPAVAVPAPQPSAAPGAAAAPAPSSRPTEPTTA